MSIRPKNPDSQWVQSYLSDSLIKAGAYGIDTPDVEVKLDQNESPWDWPEDLKTATLEKLKLCEWNRYPSAFAPQVSELVGRYIGVDENSILLGPGSNYLCALVLSIFSKQIEGDLVISQPSFPLYESHCRYEGIPYKLWPLNDQLEFDLSLMPKLPPKSMVIFASPNNPVGNVLTHSNLETLLKENPSSLFVADEAYYEFASEPYTDLLEKYGNLMLIRTFSKTMGSAGLRLGYIVASKTYLDQITKLRLPYMLNHFSIAAAETILGSSSGKSLLQQRIKDAVAARETLFNELTTLSLNSKDLNPIKSYANFVLIKFSNQDVADKTYAHLIEDKILVRNVSKGPGLQGCLRATVGTEEENQALIKSLKNRQL